MSKADVMVQGLLQVIEETVALLGAHAERLGVEEVLKDGSRVNGCFSRDGSVRTCGRRTPSRSCSRRTGTSSVPGHDVIPLSLKVQGVLSHMDDQGPGWAVLRMLRS